MIEAPSKQTTEQPVGPAYTPEMVAVLDRACQGDETVLPQLRQLLAEQPELVDQFGNLARHAEEAFLSVLADPSGEFEGGAGPVISLAFGESPDQPDRSDLATTPPG